MNKHTPPKYQPLTTYLRTQRGDHVRMSFADIERVIGAKLPHPADSHRAWWSNNPTNNVMTQAWLDAGFESELVDLKSRKLVFRRKRLTTPSSTSAPGPVPSQGSSGKLALFGWLKGTVVVNGDLTEPADPEWAKRIDDEYPPVA